MYFAFAIILCVFKLKIASTALNCLHLQSLVYVFSSKTKHLHLPLSHLCLLLARSMLDVNMENFRVHTTHYMYMRCAQCIFNFYLQFSVRFFHFARFFFLHFLPLLRRFRIFKIFRISVVVVVHSMFT